MLTQCLSKCVFVHVTLEAMVVCASWYVLAGHAEHVRWAVLLSAEMNSPAPHSGCAVHVVSRCAETLWKVSASQADRVLGLLRREAGGTFLHQLDLLEHSLQSATRAHRDGADEELVVVALLHDIGEVLCPGNHGEVAAGLLQSCTAARRIP